MKAVWKGAVVAQSEQTIIIESNHYFPRNSLVEKYFIESDKKTQCPWKGDASYLSIKIESEFNQDAAWFYPKTKDAAREITGMVAFWRGVEVLE